MQHQVRVRNSNTFPFVSRWMCICGHRFKARVMGYPLYREFAKHKENTE